MSRVCKQKDDFDLNDINTRTRTISTLGATMSNPLRPSPLSFDSSSARQSPFKRQNSASPATVQATTPTQSPTKSTASSGFSPIKSGSLSPEKTSPFVRRPSQINVQTSTERPSSPFARPTSSLGLPASPSRQGSYLGKRDETPPASPGRQAGVTPAPESDEDDIVPSTLKTANRIAPSPSPFDGSPAPETRSLPTPSQANLRPAAHRTSTSSTTSTIKPPVFGAAPSATETPTSTKPASNAFAAGRGTGDYKNVPQPLLHSMRESFEVLDSSNTGSVNSASVSSMLEQMGLPNKPAELSNFFPPYNPAQLNLARYLDILSGPIAALSPLDELAAAFSAFDVDDSGQIDVNELRNALLNTAPEPGEEMISLSEREVESVLGEFAGRRAFGAKGLNVVKGKGEVFRYRDFMASITGGGADAGVAEAGVVGA